MTASNQPRPAQPIFQPIRGRGLRRLLWKRLGIPRPLVHGALSAAKIAVNPAQPGVRRRRAAALARNSQAVGTIPASTGYWTFAPDTIPGTAEVVKRCQEIFQGMRETPRSEEGVFNPRKQYLLTLLSGDEFSSHPDLIRFMVSRPILDTVSTYMGAVPILAGATLWWTPRNDTAMRSQFHHFDGEDKTQVKVLININETGEESGPFTLLPADLSASFLRALSTRERLSDQDIRAKVGEGKEVRLTGPPGSGAFVDTSRCLHYGSRRNRKERLVLVFQFLRFQCPTESTFCFRSPLNTGVFEPDPIQKLALGVR